MEATSTEFSRLSLSFHRSQDRMLKERCILILERAKYIFLLPEDNYTHKLLSVYRLLYFAGVRVRNIGISKQG